MYNIQTLGDHQAKKLVVFQVMYPKTGAVLATARVHAETRRQAQILAEAYRDAIYPGCPLVWRETEVK